MSTNSGEGAQRNNCRHQNQTGVERQSGAAGFAYGSDKTRLATDGTCGSWNGQLDNRTSDERSKLKKQQEELQEDHRVYLAMKEVKRREKVEEQQKDLEQIQQYNPWGRPAGGASTKGYLPDGPEKSGRQKGYTFERSDSEKLLMIDERNRKFTYRKQLEEQRLEAIDRREREKRELMDAPSGYIWGRNEVSRRDPRKRVMDSDSDTYTSHISDSGFTSIAAQMRKSGYEPPVPIVNQGVEEFDPWGRPRAAVDDRQTFGENHSYYTDLQAQAELRHRQLQQTRDDDKKLDVLHTETMAQMWEKEGRQQRPDEQNVARNKEHADQLRRAMEERSAQKKQSRENRIAMEKQHNQPWSGAGAPRLSRQDQLDAIPKNSALETQVHSHWMA